MNTQPKVTVGVPSYNHARFLSAALNSALAQTYRNFEIIIVDDNSPDTSLEVAKSYAARFPNLVRVLMHPGGRNKGIGATLNLTITEGTGDYWCCLFSDDAWYPQKLERQVALMEGNPDVGLTYSLAHVIDGDGQYISVEPIGIDPSLDPEPLIRSIRVNPVPALTAMVRRECLEQLGLHDETLIYNDWDLWIRIMARWKMKFINEPLGQYRVHGSNISTGINAEVHCRRSRDVMIALSEKALQVGGALAADRVRAVLDLHAAYLSFYLEELPAARAYLSAAFDKDTSLRTDANALNEWLMIQKYDGLTPLPPHTAKRDFTAWLLANLPTRATAILARRMLAHESAQIALSCHETDLPRARRKLLECFINEPSRLKDAELRWIFAKTLLGDKAMTQIGEFKRRLRSHA